MEPLTDQSMKETILAITGDKSLTTEERRQKLESLSIRDADSVATMTKAETPPARPGSDPNQSNIAPGQPGHIQTLPRSLPPSTIPAPALAPTPQPTQPQAQLYPGWSLGEETSATQAPEEILYPSPEELSQEVQEEADSKAGFGEAGPIERIEGKSPSTGGLFYDPVDTPAARSMMRMQQDYESETGNKLYIADGQRTIEKQIEMHPSWSRERAARGQHVKKLAYDIFMVPDPAHGEKFVGGKKYRTGHKETPEFKWLDANAGKYGFVNTAPTEVKSGRKEWWHWEFTGAGGAAALPPGQEEIATPSRPDLKIPSTPEEALGVINEEYAARKGASDDVQSFLDIQRGIGARADDLSNSITDEYNKTKTLLDQQKEGAEEISRLKIGLAEKEATALALEKATKEKAAEQKELWQQKGLEQGLRHVGEVDKELDAIKARGDISPWSMFGFFKDNPETGEEEWSAGKTMFTLTSGLALIANFALTMGTSMRRKGKTVPFLVYDMLHAAIKADTDGQLASIEKGFKTIDKERTNYKDKYDIIGNKRAWIEQNKADAIDIIQTGIKAEGAKVKTQEHRNILSELDAKLEVDKAEARTARDTHIMSAQAKGADTKISALGAEKQEQRNLRGIYMNGILTLAAMKDRAVRAGRVKLTASERDRLTTAQGWLTQLVEIEKIWEQSGKSSWFAKNVVKHWDTRGWPDFMRSAIGGGFMEDGKFISADDRIAAMKGLEKLKFFQETFASNLAKMLGDVGNIAQKEAERAMNVVPLTDHSELGRWKILRFKQRVMLAGSRRYHLMSDAGKRWLRNEVLQHDDSIAGIEEQTKVIQQFLDRDKAMDMDYMATYNEDEDLRTGQTQEQAKEARTREDIINKGMKVVGGLKGQVRVTPEPEPSATAPKKKYGPGGGTPLSF